jgi:hypothetical protein
VKSKRGGRGVGEKGRRGGGGRQGGNGSPACANTVRMCGAIKGNRAGEI